MWHVDMNIGHVDMNMGQSTPGHEYSRKLCSSKLFVAIVMSFKYAACMLRGASEEVHVETDVDVESVLLQLDEEGDFVSDVLER